MNKLDTKDIVWIKLMELGRTSGCHQRPERSFFVKGYQFPVCARCTGVLAGNITALVLFFIYAPPLLCCIWGCGVMFMDWLIQRLNIRESTNIRRLITGIIGGYSLTTLYCTAIKCAVHLVIK